ncbi:hypothetical protein DICA0_C15192 [Diutina catenulata]
MLAPFFLISNTVVAVVVAVSTYLGTTYPEPSIDPTTEAAHQSEGFCEVSSYTSTEDPEDFTLYNDCWEVGRGLCSELAEAEEAGIFDGNNSIRTQYPNESFNFIIHNTNLK